MQHTSCSTSLDPTGIYALQTEAVELYDRLNSLPARTREKQTRKVTVVLGNRRWYKRLLWSFLQDDVDVRARLKPKKIRRLETANELTFKVFVALGNFEEDPSPARARTLEEILAQARAFLA